MEENHIYYSDLKNQYIDVKIKDKSQIIAKHYATANDCLGFFWSGTKNEFAT